MSVVTNVILAIGLIEKEEHIHKINDSLPCSLERVDDKGGGNKEMETYLYIGAYNYLDIGALRRVIDDCKMEEVTLMLQRQDDDHFFLLKPCLVCDHLAPLHDGECPDCRH